MPRPHLAFTLAAALSASVLAACAIAPRHRQVAADQPRQFAQDGEQRLERHARAHAHALEHVDQFLGVDVAAGAGRVRTATQAARGRVEAGDAGLPGGDGVGQGHAARIVQVNAGQVLRAHNTANRPDQTLHRCRVAIPRRVR